MANILLLEDDVAFGMRIKLALQEAGHTVALHTNATDALIYSSEIEVDLVIADILIRVEGELVQDGGITLIARIKQIQNSRVPVIAISGAFGRDPRDQAISASVKAVGAKVILPKPFEPSVLLALIDQVLEQNLSR